MNNIKNNSIRVATYARVSTQEQASEGTSLDFQAAQLTGYCQLQGWTIVNNYVDAGFTGKNGDRPGLQRLLTDAKLGLFDKMLVFKLDRLARNLSLLLEIEKALNGHGITLISMKESVDTSTGTGKMIFQMFGMVSEWERSAITERTRNGKLQRFKDGCWAGGKAPYGYSRDKETRKLVINETESRIVKRMYSEYVDGKSLFAISQGLNQDHIPPRARRSQGWWQTAVRQVLLNPVYKGTEVVNRHAHISLISKMDLSQAIMINVPALVSEQVWQIAQARMRGNKHVKPAKQGTHLLQGMITCAICGYHFASKRHYYTCRGRMKYVHPDGLSRCKAPYIRADWLEHELWKRIEEILNDPNKLLLVIKDSIENLRRAEADLSERIRPIDERLAEIAAQKNRLADDWIMRNMNVERFTELRESLNGEEARMKSLRAAVDPAQISELENTRKLLDYWEYQARGMVNWNLENEDGTMYRLVFQTHNEVLKLVEKDDPSQSKAEGFPTSKRQMLDKLQVRLSVFDDRVEVKSLFPVELIGIQQCTSARRD
jgi:site-specific DNA recombinase